MLTFLLHLYLSFVALTSRIRVTATNPECLLALREKRPAVYTFWHQQIIFLLYFFGTFGFPILMTPIGKRNTLTELAKWMGLKVAGASLEGGGRHALVTLIEQLKAKQAVVVPADGAHGPAKKCKAGCFILAQESNVPIIPISWKALFHFKIPRKQGAVSIPLPFNSIEIKLGTPILVNRHYQFAELESIRGQLSSQLDHLEE